jgi:DivIVA domain-containing protein
VSEMFPTVGRFGHGYHRGEVDSFFALARRVYERAGDEQITASEVRARSFDLVRSGYATHAVDPALDRLEAAFGARERQEFIALHGSAAWMEQVAGQARTLYGRLTRPAGDRFDAPDRGAAGYRSLDVDALLDRLIAYFDHGEPIHSVVVRDAVFQGAKGPTAYAEGPVDAFLARAIDVLIGVE